MAGQRKVAGVGVYEAGDYVAKVNGKHTTEYRIWHGMLQRCYSPARAQHYRGCSVHEDFHDYQQFCVWGSSQPGFTKEGWELDKDIIVAGNRVYSPDACVFLPYEINSIIQPSRGGERTLPKGVCWHEHSKSFVARCRTVGGKRQGHLGCFETAEQASAAYRSAKEALIRHKAEKFKGELSERAYLALICYKAL